MKNKTFKSFEELARYHKLQQEKNSSSDKETRNINTKDKE